MGRRKTLPNKPSELILLALQDIAKCEKLRKQYKIDMDVWWHVGTKGKPCVVCAAGAVMCQSLKRPRYVFALDRISDADELVENQKEPQDYAVYPEDYPENIECKLEAIDCFRQGEIQDGIDRMGIEQQCPDYLRKFPVPSYELDKRGFKRRLRTLARLLQKEGL